MEQRDTEEIERFLANVGQTSLLAYYGLDTNSTPEEREAAIKGRRAWAQGQQSNPKFKAEALFLIKQNATLRRVLLEAPEKYAQVLEGTGAAERLDGWKQRVREAVRGKVLTARVEAELRAEGARLELTDAAIQKMVDEILVEVGGTRSEDDRDELSLLAEIDLYAVLQVEPSASPADLETAYRTRYKWARNLNDIKRSQDELNQLDRAWRVLSDASRRAAYDVRRAERPSHVMGLLGPAMSFPPTDPHIGGPEPETETVVGAPIPALPPGVNTVKPVARPPIALPPPEDTPVRARPELRVVPPDEPTAETPAATLTASPTLIDPSEVSDPRGPPPPPAAVVGRTIGVGAGPVDLGRRAPRLSVAGPDLVSIGATRPSLTVRNTGSGRMPGRVTSDRDWLEVPQPALDAAATEQVIPLVYRGDKAPWGRDFATITVIGDHGERKAVQFQTFRFPWGPVVGTLLTFIVLVGAFVALFWYLSRDLGEKAGLSIMVRPRADHVYVNGSEVGQGRAVEVKLDPPFEQVRVRIQTDGFETWEQPVSLTAGTVKEVDARLKLVDPMDWGPAQDAARVPLGPDADVALERVLPDLGACFTGTGAPATVTLTWTLLVDTSGHARNVQFADSTHPDPAAEACMRAALRAVPLPPVSGGYGFHQKRVALTVPR